MLPDIRYADGSILFEGSRLQGANRITSMEIDPVHACIARHVLDMSRLSHIVEAMASSTMVTVSCVFHEVL
ncbi:SPBC119.03 [Symbiodinium necroappetens]|uniref:SPBC119.03 protein n=1 Tax=Symbiodinium necroappetens TaxID=1628268 RepID=A0A813BU53_9DINO|nr:SPBC119.03 [Symbiodinium necroappetens]